MHELEALAGFFDAVGHIDLESEPGHLPVLRLRVTHRSHEAVRSFLLWFGGDMDDRLFWRGKHTQWTIEGPDAVRALEQMQPELIALKDEADHALEVLSFGVLS